MKSRAALGNRPLHPAVVPLPIGAFFLALASVLLFPKTGRVYRIEPVPPR